VYLPAASDDDSRMRLTASKPFRSKGFKVNPVVRQNCTTVFSRISKLRAVGTPNLGHVHGMDNVEPAGAQ
jgi:hypothetical protein